MFLLQVIDLTLFNEVYVRLGKYVEILEANIGDLHFTSASQSNTEYIIEGIHTLIEAAKNISVIPSLQVASSDLLATIPAVDKKGSAKIHVTSLREVESKLAFLQARSTQLLTALKYVVAASNENTLYFKMPTDLDLESLSKVIDTIDVSLKQILSVVAPDTSVKFNGFDTGSSWLVLVVLGKGTIVLKALEYSMSLAAKALDLKKQYLELESQEIDLNLKKEQAKIHMALIKSLTDKYAKSLLQERDHTNTSGDDEMRLITALTKLKEIMQKGGNVELPLLTAQKNENVANELAITSSKLEKTAPELLDAPKSVGKADV